jgi:hypothetical protein
MLTFIFREEYNLEAPHYAVSELVRTMIHSVYEDFDVVILLTDFLNICFHAPDTLPLF